MKILIRLLLLLSMMPMAGAAAALEAVVTRVDPGGDVMLEFDSAPPGSPPGEIELTYRTGFMDMLLGRYRILSIQDRMVTARAIAISAPPSQGMRVVVTVAQTLLPTGREAGPAVAAGTPAIREGQVAAVQDRAVEIEFAAGTTVRPGDRFSLAYQAPRVGRVAIQGTWRVDRVTGNRAHAEPEGATGQPRVGQVARPLSPVPPAEAATPAGQPGGGGLFESIAAPGTLSFDAFLAEEKRQEEARRQAGGMATVPGPGAGSRGWIGLVLQGLTPDLARSLGLAPDTQGALVADVPASGPAEQAGLRPGDVILECDGQVAIPHRLTEQVRQSAPGTLLRLWLWRGGSRLFLVVRVGQAP